MECNQTYNYRVPRFLFVVFVLGICWDDDGDLDGATASRYCYKRTREHYFLMDNAENLG